MFFLRCAKRIRFKNSTNKILYVNRCTKVYKCLLFNLFSQHLGPDSRSQYSVLGADGNFVWTIEGLCKVSEAMLEAVSSAAEIGTARRIWLFIYFSRNNLFVLGRINFRDAYMANFVCSWMCRSKEFFKLALKFFYSVWKLKWCVAELQYFMSRKKNKNYIKMSYKKYI